MQAAGITDTHLVVGPAEGAVERVHERHGFCVQRVDHSRDGVACAEVADESFLLHGVVFRSSKEVSEGVSKETSKEASSPMFARVAFDCGSFLIHGV